MVVLYLILCYYFVMTTAEYYIFLKFEIGGDEGLFVYKLVFHGIFWYLVFGSITRQTSLVKSR